MVKTPSQSRSHLLSTLSATDFGALSKHFTPASLAVRLVIEDAGRPIQKICFPDSGVISVVTSNRDHPAEVGLIGREGMSGIAVVMGNDRSPHQSYVQIAGHGQMMPADALRTEMRKSPTLQASLLMFAHAYMIQTAETAAANGRATIEQRLARWFLMAHDRLDSGELPLTHEFLALMLGVRRAGVTTALHLLDKRGLISTGRAWIGVNDRAGLEELANGYYGIAEAEYRRLTGWKAHLGKSGAYSA